MQPFLFFAVPISNHNPYPVVANSFNVKCNLNFTVMNSIRYTRLAFLTFITFLAIASLPIRAHAQAQRNDVILEIATGNWCYYCPGSAMGAEELAADGAEVGIVEHHFGDIFETPSSNGRINHYGITGYPTSVFDGGANPIVGGSHTVSMFGAYREKYNDAILVPTPFALTANWTQNGNSIDVTVSVTQIGTYAGNSLRIQAVLTESCILQNWQGMTHNDFVNRAMHPNENGMAITTTQGGPAVTQTFTMAIAPGWVQQEMELVVWVEDATTKEIFNGKMVPLSTAAFPVDVSLVGIDNQVPHPSCKTEIAPEVRIRNLGADTLQAATFTYSVNGGAPSTFNWTGSLGYTDYATVTLPAINFIPQPSNTLNVSVSAAADSAMGNNAHLVTWQKADSFDYGTFMVRIKPDIWGSEITWDVKNSAGTVIASGGPYYDGNRVQINVPVPCGPLDCFSFGIYDEYGDGIANSAPMGWYLVEAPNGDTIYYGGNYAEADYVDFATTLVISRTEGIEGSFTVSPNPSEGQFELRFMEAVTGEAMVRVMAMDGKEVFRSESLAQWTTIDLRGQAAGIYLLEVVTEQGRAVQKLVKR
jgi:hypothetical protein